MSQIDPNIDIARAAYQVSFRESLDAVGFAVPSSGSNVSTELVYTYRSIRATLTGDGLTTTFIVPHNLGTPAPGIFPVLDQTGAVSSCRPQASDANTVIVTFDIAPPVGATFTCTIIG